MKVSLQPYNRTLLGLRIASWFPILIVELSLHLWIWIDAGSHYR